MRYTIILFCLVSASASAQVVDFDGKITEETLRQATEAFGIPNPAAQPGARPEGSGVTIRPLDDSDPEMRALVIRYFEAVPCRDPDYPPYGSFWRCEKARKILVDGGDRAAHYLIRQIELNEAEGWANQGTYIGLVGITESPVAYEWARGRVLALAAEREAGDRSRESQLHMAIEALGDTRMPSAADDAVALLQRFGDDDEIALPAVQVIEEVQGKHGPQPRAQEAVRALKARRHARPFQPEDDDGASGIKSVLNPPPPRTR